MTTSELNKIDIMRMSAKRIFALTSVLQGVSSASGLDNEVKDILVDIVTDNLSEVADQLLYQASEKVNE